MSYVFLDFQFNRAIQTIFLRGKSHNFQEL